MVEAKNEKCFCDVFRQNLNHDLSHVSNFNAFEEKDEICNTAVLFSSF